MIFVVLSREQAEEYVVIRPHVVVSVTDPKDTWPKLPKQVARKGCLRLKFSDWDDKAREIIRTKCTPKDRKEAVFFSKKQAERIVRFVREHLHEIDTIVVHCQAGISRSPAIAAALCKMLNGNDEQYFDYQTPRDSRMQPMLPLAEPYTQCTCGTAVPCPIHSGNAGQR